VARHLTLGSSASGITASCHCTLELSLYTQACLCVALSTGVPAHRVHTLMYVKKSAATAAAAAAAAATAAAAAAGGAESAAATNASSVQTAAAASTAAAAADGHIAAGGGEEAVRDTDPCTTAGASAAGVAEVYVEGIPPQLSKRFREEEQAILQAEQAEKVSTCTAAKLSKI
jgi:hypothetical protein